MKIIFLDFETFYSKDFTLRKLTPVEYILDPRFEVIGCAVKEGLNGKSHWVDGSNLQSYFDSLDPNDVMLVSHNALFDMCIVAWIYGFVPRVMSCTLSIARAVLGHLLKSLSLASVMAYLGLGKKGDTVLKVIGMNALAIQQASLWDEYVNYALDDVSGCAGIWNALVVGGQFPINELAVLDMVLRAAVTPQFYLDRNMLAEHAHEVAQEKEQLLARVGLLGGGKASLMSNDQFAELLQSVGVDPPTKISLATDKETWAFAKTDPEFLELEEHENPMVQALVAARLGIKSTLEETRVARLMSISNLDWPGKGQVGLMPVPLKYSGAKQTHRLSGDWKINMQNLRRGGKLRRALTAPEGHKVLTVDSSQIEARLVAFLAEQWDLVELFEQGEDVYAVFASKVFGFQVTKLTHPTERFVGKQGVLGLGYNLGADKFQRRLRTDSKNQTGTEIILPVENAERVVNTYRGEYREIPALWRWLNYTAIPIIAWGGHEELGPVKFEKGSVLLPSGLRLHYNNLAQDEAGEWWFTHGVQRKKLYGGKLLENICQALARVLTFDAGGRITRRTGYRLALQAHDENAYVVRDQDVEAVCAVALEEMTRRPTWGAKLPLAAEVGVGQTYGDAK
jgi:hypothetical protein